MVSIRCQISGVSLTIDKTHQPNPVILSEAKDLVILTLSLPGRTYRIRAASSPNSGNSKRSPCHALSDRTIHKNNIASETKMPNSRKIMAAATFEKKSAAMVRIKNATHSEMLCQA